jgi:3-oxoacyl-[acyl-carrier protein] reductase
MAEVKTRWAVVTGASSGIGAATALGLARSGWDVVIHFRRSSAAAEAIAHEVRQLDRKAMVLQADFEQPDAAANLVDHAWRATGQLLAWVHVAGADLLTGSEAKAPFLRKLDLALRVDLMGTMLACREVGRRMRECGAGAIVTVGWDQAATGMEGESGELFAAVKAGVMAFSRSLARSLAPTVRVNCVAPGWIQTAWGRQASPRWHERVRRETLLGRWGTPDDVAKTIAFLVSDDAAFLTGQMIAVNGGAVTL